MAAEAVRKELFKSMDSKMKPACLSKIKPAVLRVEAYTLRHFDATIKINQNENPFDMPEPVKKAVASAMAGKSWSRYPDFVPTELAEKLASFSGWKPEGILVGNGSNELIQAILAVTVQPGTTVVLPQPTFTLYKLLTAVMGGDCHEVFLTANLEFDIDRLLEASSHSDLTIICSPNNPTGCLLGQEQLQQILKATPGLVVLDEAYHEFSRQTVVPLLREFDNLVVLRTFSKAMAMAGLRVGYLLGAPAIVREIAKAKLPYNLNIFSMIAAQAAIEHFDLLKPQIELIIQERERVHAILQELAGVRVYPSQANFLAMETDIPPAELFDLLYQEGILVRDISKYPMLSRFLRISIGTPAENDKFLDCFKAILGACRIS
jgi:histidinol-phosphate aminotransferase